LFSHCYRPTTGPIGRERPSLTEAVTTSLISVYLNMRRTPMTAAYHRTEGWSISNQPYDKEKVLSVCRLRLRHQQDLDWWLQRFSLPRQLCKC